MVCSVCGIEKNESFFEKNRKQCKFCRSKQHKNRREFVKSCDIVMYKCLEMSRSANSRIFAGSRAYKKSYRVLDNPFGFSNIKEMAVFLYDNFYSDIKRLIDSGLRPSVDRIDNSVGYTKENIRIVEFNENSGRGYKGGYEIRVIDPVGKEILFPSFRSCSEYFNVGHRTIRHWVDGTTSRLLKPNGYEFCVYKKGRGKL